LNVFDGVFDGVFGGVICGVFGGVFGGVFDGVFFFFAFVFESSAFSIPAALSCCGGEFYDVLNVYGIGDVLNLFYCDQHHRRMKSSWVLRWIPKDQG
jgi:hypothetical protein